MTATSLGIDRYGFPGDEDVRTTPRLVPTRPLVIVCHGAGNNAQSTALRASLAGGAAEVLRQITEQGFPCVTADLDASEPNAFGAPPSSPGCVELVRQQAVMDGYDAQSIYLVMFSMGGLTGLRWVAYQDHSARCLGALGIVPIVDLNHAYQNNLIFRGAIEDSWDLTWPEALPEGSDPASQPEAYDGVPIALYTSSTDTSAPAAQAADFVTSVSDGEQFDLGALGHSFGNTQPLIEANARLFAQKLVEWDSAPT